MKSIQYTIRSVPEKVDNALRHRAARLNKSFNQTLLEALQQASGVDVSEPVSDDLDWFIGGKKIDKTEFDASQDWLESLPSKLS